MADNRNRPAYDNPVGNKGELAESNYAKKPARLEAAQPTGRP